MALDALVETLQQPELWIAAFAGGAFGASIGALPAFVFTGFAVIAGEMARLTEGGFGEMTNLVGFGPVFGPHISFAGGVAAAAYAAKKGYMDFGFDYHEGKNITAALGTRPDVLLVGGVFGVLGMVIRQAVQAGIAAPLDAIALTVVVSALIARLAFGYELIGSPRGDGFMDMTPFEREEIRTAAAGGDGGDGAEPATDGGVPAERLAVEPWLPQQYKWSGVAVLGIVAGILGGYLYVITGSMFLGFGISAASLLFLNLGVEEFPVTHHITIVASAGAAAAAASGPGIIAGVGDPVAVVIGAVFGCISALFGEAFQRVFYAHGDTHVDPPAAAIAFGTLVIGLLYAVGVFGGAGYVPTGLVG